MLNLRETIKFMDEEFEKIALTDEYPSIYINHNAGLDRDLSASFIADLKHNAENFGWYDTSIWVTGTDTQQMISQIYEVPYNVTKYSINPTLAILYGRPIIIIDKYVKEDTLSRIYLINYDDGPIGAVIGDLQ